jgi:putative transposase
MPRQPRLDAPGALHHVMARGIERKRIFKNKLDKEDFLKRLAELCDAESLALPFTRKKTRDK